MKMKELLARATKFEFDGMNLEKRGSYLWAITDNRFVLNHDGNWEYEPFPSSSDEEFIEQTRWNFEEAIGLIEKWKKLSA